MTASLSRLGRAGRLTAMTPPCLFARRTVSTSMTKATSTRRRKITAHKHSTTVVILAPSGMSGEERLHENFTMPGVRLESRVHKEFVKTFWAGCIRLHR
jgi:hypothetical protein